MTDTTRRDAIARDICRRICDSRRSLDELRVVDQVLAGLERGADDYGPLDLARDQRDFGKEAAEELRDCLVYLAARAVAENDRRLERLRCEAADEIAAAEDAAARPRLWVRDERTAVERGLAELRDAEPIDLLDDRFDDGGE